MSATTGLTMTKRGLSMVDILHRVGVKSSPDATYAALTTRDGLAAWWAADTQGDGAVGDVLRFGFEAGGIDMQVVELVPGRHVLWRVVGGPDEWIGTQVSWDLKQEGDYTVLLFSHRGWREPVEFMYHCSTTWGSFLMSLKQLLETGTGAPEPRDVKIGNWG
jgi:uncharacterized protein YndB with AHSA1/START domain